MKELYERLKTPYKYGVVLKFDDFLCDSPCVFRHENHYYMTYIRIAKDTVSSGYESFLAESDDLLHWKTLFPIYKRSEQNVWDAKQRAVYAGMIQNDIDGDFSLQRVNGKYYFNYLGGNLDGYETDPLQMGEIASTDFLDQASYLPFEKPILSPMDRDARKGERLTIYKGNLFIDEQKTLGHRYVNFYNAKDEDDVERIFVAVSDDGERWKRYGEHFVFEEPNAKITGDPQILRVGERYVMLYFVLRDGKTYNNFAVSDDLIHFTRWDGEPLIKSEYPWEDLYAHKVGFIVKDGVNYHFYCAVNSLGERFIALATSKDLKEKK